MTLLSASDIDGVTTQMTVNDKQNCTRIAPTSAW
jgi:hypothetical protein